MKHVSPPSPLSPPIPDYLETYYWWAYVRPWAISFFENSILVNVILWGYYGVLRAAVLEQIAHYAPRRILQIACVYGDLTPKLLALATTIGSEMDVVDIVAAQLANLRRKLPLTARVNLMQHDSSALHCPDQSYDCALMFFLLHEQPAAIRTKTLAQAWRVLAAGGRLIIVDFASPRWWHPLRYFWLPLLNRLEPFGADLWGRGAGMQWLAEDMLRQCRSHRRFCGGLFQLLVLEKPRQAPRAKA
jgi:ubiquinone/menaquinone biosynthesis C-methylase UbiE